MIFEEVLDKLGGGEEARRVGLDDDVDQDGEQVVSTRRTPHLGILEETDQNSAALGYAVDLPSW